MVRQSIIIIEDEEDIFELLSYNLRKEGYTVAGYTSGEEGVSAIGHQLPDLVLLDLMLPGMSGYEVCTQLKSQPATREIPIIMVTAKGEEADVVAGLEHGADDYLSKPFSIKILIARIKAIFRRQENSASPAPAEEIITYDGLTIHPGRHEVTVEGQEVVLTSTEFRILHFLASRPGWVFTRNQIVNNVHQDDFAVTARAIDVQIVSLRKKLGRKKYIETVRGVGYRFRG